LYYTILYLKNMVLNFQYSAPNFQYSALYLPNRREKVCFRIEKGPFGKNVSALKVNFWISGTIVAEMKKVQQKVARGGKKGRLKNSLTAISRLVREWPD